VARAIARGVEYLKGEQETEGNWSYSFSHDHVLGITALAGLALLENGVDRADPAVAKAERAVRRLAAGSDQTYDLSLAILFLARVGQGARGGPDDGLIRRLAERLAGGGADGFWGYTVPLDAGGSRRGRRWFRNTGPADNSNTQFALLGIWAAGRHGFDSNEALGAIDRHFRSTRVDGGGWGYRTGMPGENAMTCAGLMGLAIASARPKLAERQTARARGAALAADPVFAEALRAVARDAREIDGRSDIYYLWSLERVCVALGLRRLDGFDWYAAGARELLDRQQADGSWPQTQWGTLPNTCLALLFLRKANLAFELDRVLKLPDGSKPEPAVAEAERPEDAPKEEPAPQGGGDATVVVTGAHEEKFPEIAVDFEVKRLDGSFLLDARAADFRVTESGREVPVLGLQSPTSTEARPITVVLVVDRSLSMEEEDRMGGLKRAVATFLKGLPPGSRVAVIAFGSEVEVICPFTDDFRRAGDAVDALAPAGATRYYDAVAEALDLISKEGGRRAVLALTDGEDTFSQSADLASVILAAQRQGTPVHTLGLGSEQEIESGALRKLASSTRGQYYPARRADQLRSIYEQLAERLKSSYTLVYKTDRRIPDGTLRPVRVYYRQSRGAGETAVFIPGMVVPASGWSPLFLLILAVLAVSALGPGWARSRRAKAH
jgi:VWFA-related protein